MVDETWAPFGDVEIKIIEINLITPLLELHFEDIEIVLENIKEDYEQSR